MAAERKTLKKVKTTIVDVEWWLMRSAHSFYKSMVLRDKFIIECR